MKEHGTSLVLRIQRLPGPGCSSHTASADACTRTANAVCSAAAGDRLLELRHRVDRALGLPTTVHVYISPASQLQPALPLHSDEADVLVVQLNGTKNWDVCAPRFSSKDALAVQSGAATAATNLLDIWARWDARRFNKTQNFISKMPSQSTVGVMMTHTGTPYDEIDLAAYKCSKITMQAGDRLYMPFGILHRAKSGEIDGSIHATFEFGKKWAIEWADLFLAGAEFAERDRHWFERFASAAMPANSKDDAGDVGGAQELMSAVRKRVIAGALLKLALRYDPGFFPQECPASMCEKPGASTPQSGELVAPVPIWLLLSENATWSETFSPASFDANDAGKDAVYSEYLRVLKAVLLPQLNEVATELHLRPQVAEWVASVSSKVIGIVNSADGKMQTQPVDANEVHNAIAFLTTELLASQQTFEKALRTKLMERNSRVQSSACPDPSST